jgi:hypothetical protein
VVCQSLALGVSRVMNKNNFMEHGCFYLLITSCMLWLRFDGESAVCKGHQGQIGSLKRDSNNGQVLPSEYLDHIYPSQVRSFKIKTKTTQTWADCHEGHGPNTVTGGRFGHLLYTVFFENGTVNCWLICIYQIHLYPFPFVCL